MSSNPISAHTSPAPTPAPTYRSKKKLRMESHYFNTTLLHKKSSSTPATDRKTTITPAITTSIEEDEIKYPTTKYKTNSKNWFVYAFGIGSDTGPSQLSDGGRPAHYGITSSITSESEVPRTWQGLLDISSHYHNDNKVSHQARSGLIYAPAPEPQNIALSISKKRLIPDDFVTDYDQRREKARARIDADWEFGRAVARKQLIPKSKNKPAIPKKVVETRKSGRIMGRAESTATTTTTTTTTSKPSGKEMFGSTGMVILRMNVVTVGEASDSD
ncbi:uncharacterized protein LAJ45_07209 [Morchella importuna]|uniref:Uncharacterized protein n=1 Tax=Morchella conica CCBAS932 TaxID=1392247 RepID=A0A3N4KL15_9PEZI|nr:uncharacterized protein LAJ45_07209 [Morchella importuna]KAH8148866.1 hypothetical protein LAJ45_07209 [Morchella importuna]RPB09992.1 hypothetical protein P167DRAFT_547544 [Morchella conica CCBAS932]